MPFGFEKSDIVDRANAVRRTLTGDFAEVQSIVDRCELVIAIWTDNQEADGVGVMLVKGQRLLADIAFGSQSQQVTWNAIPCTCAEQAEALRRVAGEKTAYNG